MDDAPRYVAALHEVHRARQAGDFVKAVNMLDRAARMTRDRDELDHIVTWRARLLASVKPHHPGTCAAKGMFGRDCVRCEAYRNRPRKRTYYRIRVNCDCGSYLMARTSRRWNIGPRCRGCHKILGPMEYSVLGTVRAAGEREALQAE